jgi:hypothetical protein
MKELAAMLIDRDPPALFAPSPSRFVTSSRCCANSTLLNGSRALINLCG